MKRLLVRMTLLSLVVGLGTVVVYEAQHRLHPPEAPSTAAVPTNLEPRPIPLVASESGAAPTADPYGMPDPSMADPGFRLAASNGPPPENFQSPDRTLPPAETPTAFEATASEPYAQAGPFGGGETEPGRLAQSAASVEPLGSAEFEAPARG
ncbi:MAG TPA: hypothetical protein VGG30_03220, partial [Pirellulales bacterium]